MRKSSNITLLFKMKDGIAKAMKCGENKLSVQIFLKLLILSILTFLYKKFHKLHFSKTFLHHIMDYLLNRTYFVQINSSYSFNFVFKFWCTARVNFGVPQGSILNDCFSHGTCLNYADDFTIYQHCRVKDTKTC